MTRTPDEPTLRLAIPKGRMYDGVTRLLGDAGIHLTQTVRSYRPHISLSGCEVKILKPQTIGIIPINGYRACDRQSAVAVKWLMALKKTRGLRIRHTGRKGEVHVGPFKVDGMDAHGVIY